MTTAEMLAQELAYEKNETFKGYVVADLRTRFDALLTVTLPDGTPFEKDWKGPIDALVDGKDMEGAIIAIEFFTGAPTRVVYTDPTGRSYIHSDGYYSMESTTVS